MVFDERVVCNGEASNGSKNSVEVEFSASSTTQSEMLLCKIEEQSVASGTITIIVFPRQYLLRSSPHLVMHRARWGFDVPSVNLASHFGVWVGDLMG